MDLTWLGTAGFIIKTKDTEIAFDPFLSRGQGKPSPFSSKSFENTEAIFVGHGHFDHTYDIPEIVAGSDLNVFAPGLTGKMLKMRGVPESRLLHTVNDEILFKPLKMRAFHSSHVHFDIPLIVSTVKRCGVKGCLHMLPLVTGYPKGLVQTYFFEVNGKKVLFASTAGCTDRELNIYRKLEIDYFLAPVQGNTDIQEIVAKQMMIIQPKVIIPHHHDDFYPPLSQEISLGIFRDKLKFLGFKGELLEIPLFDSSQI
ncbi:MAG: MBL fold metallo-hydrolase [Bdellovibrionaceae bacterium]|nr:MBL fold metallo-hydrolase [Pseudobdellovibrionaceae bacterium]